MEEIKQELKYLLGEYKETGDDSSIANVLESVEKQINLAVSKERERRDAQIIEFINSGEPAPWNDTGWSVELSDVEKFIKNTK